MSTTEGLLSAEDGGAYQMTPLGSQMADLMADLDGCSDAFIEGYKEMVVKAALTQRHRLGQGPANQREIAAITNISLDSVRRGLLTLIEGGLVVEDKAGRVVVYSLVAPPVAATSQPTTDSIQDVLAGIDDDDVLPVAPTPPEADEEVPLSLGAILQDEGVEADPPPPEPTPAGDRPEAGEPPPPQAPFVLPEHVFQMLRAQAEAVELPDWQFLDQLLRANAHRMRLATNGIYENMLRVQMGELIKPRRG
jgi:hypothetical protein